ncbi:MAG: GNAT family N-acetyltransferase [Urechidicola sp.]|nr:GNAT family N-acetyltransferase [Urechidicola sp.]
MLNYTFTSSRLGFRNWEFEDIEKMHLINIDKDVMEFFPSIPTYNETEAFVLRMQQSYAKNGYCYLAVDILETKEFIGFIGLSHQTFEADFTPCIDIGWRLKKSAWGKGFATEGAKRCLEFRVDTFNLKSICSIAPVLNLKSQQVMEKIGMHKIKTFLHPEIENGHPLQKCVLYKK